MKIYIIEEDGSKNQIDVRPSRESFFDKEEKSKGEKLVQAYNEPKGYYYPTYKGYKSYYAKYKEKPIPDISPEADALKYWIPIMKSPSFS